MPVVTRTGTVLSMSRSGSAMSAKVHFTEPPPGETVLFEITAADWADFRDAKFAGAKVTLTYDDAAAPPSPTAVGL